MVKNHQKIVEKLKEQYPEAWANAHTDNEHTEDFVRIVAREIHKIDKTCGLNGKRGDPSDISDDALCFKDSNGFDFDPTANNAKRTVIDFIQNAGAPNASVVWNVAKNETPTGAAWVKPTSDAPKPPEPPKPAVKDRETFYREMRELNDFYASFDGLQRPGGMVIHDKADIEALASWGYNFIVEGWSVEQAKEEIRKSLEWRAKH